MKSELCLIVAEMIHLFILVMGLNLFLINFLRNKNIILMKLKRPLGELQALKIFHDNSGKDGNQSSWYLKNIVVQDLQTRNKFLFICEQWLAVDKGDSQIERVLHLSQEQEQRDYKYLLEKQAKHKLSDEHLWFSIFARPVQSAFTRLDRVTCCFVLLSISMVMNIMYYDLDKSESNGGAGLKIGPYLNITLQQISVGIITSIIVFLPSILLVGLFRRTKRRHTGIEKLRKILENPNVKQDNPTVKKPSFKLQFPWWFKVFAYLFAFALAAVSLFFVIIKGIVLGNEKVTSWIISLVISFFSSLFLIQPLKVIEFNSKQRI
jgi:hypothetical protein